MLDCSDSIFFLRFQKEEKKEKKDRKRKLEESPLPAISIPKLTLKMGAEKISDKQQPPPAKM